jgi:enterochelin esterase-like enzyme
MRRVQAIALGVLAVAALAGGVVVAATRGPDRHGAALVRFHVDSRLVGRRLEQQAVVPAGIADGTRRPLLVFLHGRGGHAGDFFTPELYDELERLGPRAPIVLAVNGGDHSYFHDRSDGRWGSYVMREVLPSALRRLPADPRRIAIGGISMGGFGALDLARLNPGRFCAVGAHSPAIWATGGESAPGAFDDASDFARHDLVAYARRARRPWGGATLWLDRGDRDWFVRGDATLLTALRGHRRRVSAHLWRGGHDGDYWSAHTADYLRFYSRALARC